MLDNTFLDRPYKNLFKEKKMLDELKIPLANLKADILEIWGHL